MGKQKKRADGRFKSSFTFKGKRYYVYGRSKQELIDKEVEKRKELEEGRERRENPSMNEFYQTWTESRRGSVKESTLRGQVGNFKAMASVQIKDAGRTFGELKLSEVTVEDVREVQRALIGAGRTIQTTNDMMAHLYHVFRVAIDERRITYNPCRTVKPLKRTEERARDTHHRALSEEETAAFFKEAAGSHYYDVFRFAINTGMRCGEIGALYETDIKAGIITVERTITRTENGSYIIGDDAKTKAGRREIPVNDAIKEIINHQKAINRMLYGSKVRSIHETIFKAAQGGLLMATPIDREIKRICNQAGIEYFTMHALRATFATRLIENGVNPRTVQELLGHADFSITMNLYGHVLDKTKNEAMQRISIAI